MNRGDNIIFYRCGTFHTGVITTIGVVNNVYTPKTFDEFKDYCKRRTIFSNQELENIWNFKRNKPFVVEFLYAYSFPKPKVNLKALCDANILFIRNMPRGFYRISQDKFDKILEMTRTNTRYVVE